jgi:orotidine-5'-phosphate decarboxylase
VSSPVLARLEARIDAVDSLLCVGLDSAIERLPERFRSSSRPQAAFGCWIVDETHELVAAYKPNLAFYEARGAAGWDELAETLAHIRDVDPGIFIIGDAKRADIDSTNAGYVAGLLDGLGFDAVTLHPYLGGEALRPFLARPDKAAIVLCRTSNPGAGELQDLDVGGVPLWEVVATHVRDDWNARGNCMLVVGATYPAELRRARELCPDMPFLVPGVGAQGGDVASVVHAGIDRHGRGLLVNASRSVIFAADPQSEARTLRDAIRAAVASSVAASPLVSQDRGSP